MLLYHLSLKCSHCRAGVELTNNTDTSDQITPLKTDGKIRRKLSQARAYIQNNARMTPDTYIPPEPELVPFLKRESHVLDIHHNTVLETFSILDIYSKYVLCPVCNTRIYVC